MPNPPMAVWHPVGALQKKCRTHCSAERASIVPAGKYTVSCVYVYNTAFLGMRQAFFYVWHLEIMIYDVGEVIALG